MENQIHKRRPLLIVVCGRKGSGKTFTTLQWIKEYVRGNPRTGATPRKALILDINGEFEQFKTIPLKMVKAFSSQARAEVRRVTIFKNDGSKMTLDEIADMLYYILENYKNGLLLVEDVTKYIGDSLPKDVVGALCTQRHVGVDVILHFQILGKAGHPKIISNINIFRIHECGDSAERHKDKFQAHYTAVKLAQILVDIEFDKGDKSKFYNRKEQQVFFYVSINADKRDKLLGDFDRAMFQAAIHEYINQHHGETVGRYLRKRNESGELIYNYETAYKQVQADFFRKYYGNLK